MGGLELMMGKYDELRTNFENLKVKVNDLSNEMAILKNLRNDSHNHIENAIQTNITESFKNIKLSLDGNLNKLNQMFTDNCSQNSLLLNQLSINAPPKPEDKTSIQKSIQKPIPTDTDSKPTHTESPKSSSLFSKPVHISQPFTSLKPLGDCTDTDSIVKQIANASSNLPKPELPKTKPADKEPPKSMFGSLTNQNSDTSSSSPFTKFSPSKEPTKPLQGLFSSLNTTLPPASSVPLFGGLKATVSPAVTGSLFGSPMPQPGPFSTQTAAAPGTGLFGVQKPAEPATLFGTKTSVSVTATSLFGSGNAAKSSVASPTSLFGASAKPPIAVSSSGLFGGGTATAPGSFTFGPTTAPAPTREAPVFGSDNGTPSFSFLSSAASDAPSFGSASEVSWKAGQKLFSHPVAGGAVAKDQSATELDAEAGEGNGEEHDPHFQPIIDLPPLVAVSKDEESHEVLFRSRCKLYRYIDDEWKERGVGEMKVLQTLASVDAARPVKLLMRRDQVRKVCCNQRVTKSVPCFAAMPNVKSTCWVGNDFSEGAPTPEKFAVRFSVGFSLILHLGYDWVVLVCRCL